MTSSGTAQKPKLLVLTSTYPRWSGDPEPGFVHELSKRLVEEFDVMVLGPHAAGAPFEEVMDGVRVRRYRYAPAALETLVNDGGIVTNLRRAPRKWLLLPGFLLSALWSTWRTIASHRPDVVHAHWLIPQGLILATLSLLDRRTPPFLVTSHGADLFALKARPFGWLKRFVSRRAAAMTVVSSAMLAELSRLGIDVAKVGVQPMGVDLMHRFTPDPSVLRSGDEILFVGRLVEKKGLRHLIDAMPLILRVRPSVFLTIAGFGPDEGRLRTQAGQLGVEHRVSFLGAVEQESLPGLYRRAGVFVAPFVRAASGDQEGLGLVLVEAAGCGCPLVVGNVPAVDDVLGGGKVGQVVDVRNAEVLASAILAALSVDWKEDLQARLEQVRQFDWGYRASAYAQLLRAGMDGRRVPADTSRAIT